MEVFFVFLLIANAVSLKLFQMNILKSFLQLADSSENSTQCDGSMLPANFSAKECCQLPVCHTHTNRSALASCLGNCNETDRCCKSLCNYDALDIFVGNKFEKLNFKKMFATNYTNEGDSELNKDWDPIVEKSVNKCYEEREV